MKTKYFLYIFFTLFLLNCKKANPKKEEETKSPNLNISLLLDLSDRIDTVKNSNSTMEYYQRDIRYIKSVENAFINHIKQKKVIQMNDQMQVFFNPEPSNPEINKLSQELKVYFDKNSNKEKIKIVDNTFSNIPLKIYKSAIDQKEFIGSDIWKFFKNKVKDYCIKDDHRNLLIILTDGYMYHKDSKFTEGNKSSFLTPEFIREKKLNTSDYKELFSKNNLGFIPATQNLDKLEVLVLGINPDKKNPYEEEVINLYWEDWFKNMGVKKYYLKDADLPTNLDAVIQNIIMNK